MPRKIKMYQLKHLWQIWRNDELEFMLNAFMRHKEKIKEEREIALKMQSLNLYPVVNIGNAIKEANRYGLEFNVGTAGYDCRAILPRSKWKKPIDKTVPLKMLAFFTIPQSYEEIENIQGISDRIEIAICKCLIMARIAGVI